MGCNKRRSDRIRSDPTDLYHGLACTAALAAEHVDDDEHEQQAYETGLLRRISGALARRVHIALEFDKFCFEVVFGYAVGVIGHE